MAARTLFCIFSLAATLSLQAQHGDKPGEQQIPPIPASEIPPAPVLSPEQALHSFKLAPGFRIELVAAEPLVSNPVALQFDANGDIWVVEMRGFMPNVDGRGEDKPVGRIVVLRDTNGDGRMDRQTVFLDHLVMPRALSLVDGGVLVAEPPHLWFCRDTDGDGHCDTKTEIADDYGSQANPEHTANGLLWAMDNWIYSANFTAKFRYRHGAFQRAPTIFRGQWGITQDNDGRLFYNSNSDQLRGDLVPADYLERNPEFPDAAGSNVQIAHNQHVWPARVNPGVNRGYRKGQLRPNGTLATFTAACGPVIYRGDLFPPGFQGNAFVCEPAGNLVKRDILVETNGVLVAHNAYSHSEFLASTDERFRPVNAYNGPDGALYIVDMYHGILQHRIYMTTYLRNQILSRDLQGPNGLGRIYRILPQGAHPRPAPHLAQATPTQLAKALSSRNGWTRDTAQRLLVQEGNLDIVPRLKQMARFNLNPWTRLQSLWTLDGLDQLDQETLFAALGDQEPKVRAAAIRLSERLLRTPSAASVVAKWLEQVDDPSPTVKLQLLLTLGQSPSEDALDAMAMILERHCESRYLRDAALSGLGGRELPFLERLTHSPQWNSPKSGRRELFRNLAACIFRAREASPIKRLLEIVREREQLAEWQSLALLQGIVRTAPRSVHQRTQPVRLTAEPTTLISLLRSPDPALQELANHVASLLTWPGKAGYEATPAPVTPLTPKQQERFAAGKKLFAATCGACHQLTGNGMAGLAPPLRESDWALGPERRIIRIVLDGLHGPIDVEGKHYQMEMPPLGIFTDEQIADVLTYVRRAWDHTADPVNPKTVTAVRAATQGRNEAWTAKELLQIQ